MENSNLKITSSQLLKLKTGKKRPTNIDTSKIALQKIKRNSGQPYISQLGYPVPGKLPPSQVRPCGVYCRKEGCLMGMDTKLRIFRDYYNIADYEQQSTFLLAHISRIEQRLTEDEDDVTKTRYRYYLPANGEKKEVCRTFFMEVLKIKERRIRVIQDKLLSGETFGKDHRGKHNNRPNRLDNFALGVIENSIERFRTRASISHYKRNNGDPLQLYLPAGLTLGKMFQSFVEENPNFVKAPFLKRAYETQFKKSGLKIAKLRSDTCSTCERLHIAEISTNVPEEILRIRNEAEIHHEDADSAYRTMNEDIRLAKENIEEIKVLCVDMQQVLFCPTLEHKEIYYQRQYSCYNYCVYDAGQDSATMCFWGEADATRGSEELLSCLWRYVQENFRPLAENQRRTLILWSDRCYGQNNNFLTLVFGKLLIARRYFTTVEQKFLRSGHSFLACDRLFALIEKQKRICKAFVPTEWIQIFQNSRPSRPFNVQVMELYHFLAFDDLLEYVPRPNTLKVSEALWIRMTIEEEAVILTKRSHNNDEEFRPHVIREPFSERIRIDQRAEWSSRWINEDFALRQRHEEPLPIDRQKYADLQRMVDFIRPEYREFYQNLRHL